MRNKMVLITVVVLFYLFSDINIAYGCNLSENQFEEEYILQSSSEKQIRENTECFVENNMKEKPVKRIYITFDDGPSSTTTTDIINILKKYNIKATFFVVGNQINGREKILKRIHNEGHSIGLHSYTHDFKSIYKNEKVFLNEMKWTSNKIMKVTGVKTKIVRFPGGSIETKNNNIISSTTKNGYKIYDWNAQTDDGIKPRTSSKLIYNNALKVSDNKNNVILLLHCRENNKNTVKALPYIIEYYKNHGYNFCVIDENTPEYCFRRR